VRPFFILGDVVVLILSCCKGNEHVRNSGVSYRIRETILIHNNVSSLLLPYFKVNGHMRCMKQFSIPGVKYFDSPITLLERERICRG